MIEDHYIDNLSNVFSCGAEYSDPDNDVLTSTIIWIINDFSYQGDEISILDIPSNIIATQNMLQCTIQVSDGYDTVSSTESIFIESAENIEKETTSSGCNTVSFTSNISQRICLFLSFIVVIFSRWRENKNYFH